MMFLVHKCELNEKNTKEFRQSIVMLLQGEASFLLSADSATNIGE